MLYLGFLAEATRRQGWGRMERRLRTYARVFLDVDVGSRRVE